MPKAFRQLHCVAISSVSACCCSVSKVFVESDGRGCNPGNPPLNAPTIETNLDGPIRMVNQFLPHLKKQKSLAIVNVTSGLAFVPFPGKSSILSK
jgi:hypothetical protein